MVIGDLASGKQTRDVADQVNAVAGIDAVVHNAAIYVDDRRVATPERHTRTLAVNVLAPYLLTAWINGPSRLVYLSSDMHRSGDSSLCDIDWTTRRWNGVQAYCDSKLYITTFVFGRRGGGRVDPSTRSTQGGCPPGWAAPAPPTTWSSATEPRPGSP